jgi:hypothetical protein
MAILHGRSKCIVKHNYVLGIVPIPLSERLKCISDKWISNRLTLSFIEVLRKSGLVSIGVSYIL